MSVERLPKLLQAWLPWHRFSVACRGHQWTRGPPTGAALQSSPQGHKQMSVPARTCPTALVVNSLTSLPEPSLCVPLR